MKIRTISCNPIEGQKPGTSGLRKKTRVFMEPGYLEQFVQSVFNAIGGLSGKRLVIGGDGRFYNDQAIQIIAKMAAANEAAELIIGQNGILSTPAVSNLIRKNSTDGGIILSASHNPGGIEEDFGIKFNGKNGGPAPEKLTELIFGQTESICEYSILEADDINLQDIGTTQMGSTRIKIIDPVADYAELMGELFDFDAIRNLIAGGFSVLFDAMHAVTGPYAWAVLEQELGAPSGSVINAVPLEDFGGGHPDPNPVWAKPLVDEMMKPDGPDFGAASDGDGDRNMIVGKGIYVTPSDSLAILAANAHLAPAYSDGITGVARSMPTSGACDRVAEKLGFACFETPTGWKFFGNLLDADKVTLCGEESAGTGSNHVREKDGLWAVLLWLNIIAKRNQPVAEILAEHWQEYGRNYYSRHDFENVSVDDAEKLMNGIVSRLDQLPGQEFGALVVNQADQFSYEDPVDQSLSTNQGIRLFFEGGARAVLRLSGTGTQGATIRLYLEQYVVPEDLSEEKVEEVLAPVLDAALELGEFQKIIGRIQADVIS